MYRLRELDAKDIPAINQWRNDPELISLLGAPFRYINQRVDEKWFEGYMANRNSTVRCSIVEESQDEILGLISLTSIDQLNQSAELHIMIGNQDNQGRGMGTFAVREMLYHAFCNLNLHRVELTVMAHNLRAQHLYEKVGFVREGIKRKARYKNGTFIDVYCYAILKEEYLLHAQRGTDNE